MCHFNLREKMIDNVTNGIPKNKKKVLKRSESNKENKIVSVNKDAVPTTLSSSFT